MYLFILVCTPNSVPVFSHPEQSSSLSQSALRCLRLLTLEEEERKAEHSPIKKHSTSRCLRSDDILRYVLSGTFPPFLYLYRCVYPYVARMANKALTTRNNKSIIVILLLLLFLIIIRRRGGRRERRIRIRGRGGRRGSRQRGRGRKRGKRERRRIRESGTFIEVIEFF